MALLDPIAVLQGVLDTVMTQELVLANRSDTGPGIVGSGTLLDPYGAAGSPTDIDPPFDQIMRAVFSSGQARTVRLLPGTYYTRGFLGTGSSSGWRPGSGLRLLGSGMRTTTLKRVDSLQSGLTIVIGNDYATQSVDGLEISDLTVDANFQYISGTIISGIGVYGSNILVKRVRVKCFGANSTAQPCFGISLARTPATAASNCIAAECTIDTPSTDTNATAPIAGLYFCSEALLHADSVIRDCFIDLSGGPATSKTGISVGGGEGTIVEFNRILNCTSGIQLPSFFGNYNPTGDLTLRHNYIRLAPTGIELIVNANAIGGTIGRTLLLNNVIEWPQIASASTVLGIWLHSVAIGSNTPFTNVIARDNVMRRYDNTTNGNENGVIIEHAQNVIMDQNLVDAGTTTKGVQFNNTDGTIKPLNNIKSDGTLLQTYNSSTSASSPELATILRDADISLFKR